MLLMKCCNRCKGDMFVEEEGTQKALVCLQCGHRPVNGPAIAEKLLQRARIMPRVARAA